ncbi:MAG TPA: response regulator [Ruminiclostridium sp.]
MLKVLLVDDEEWVRLDLRECIKWCSFDLEIAGEAQNGVEAKIAIEKLLPDIVITDIRMPLIDGIKLIEYIHEAYPQIITIIISGYSEFEYARSAITFNVFDYILKPIEEEKLKEVLKKAIEKIQTNQNNKESFLSFKMQLNESKPYMKNKLLNELISNDNMETDNIQEILKKADFDFSYLSYVVIAVKVLNFSEIITEKYSNDCSLGEYSLLNIIEEIVCDKNDAVVFKNYYRQNELVIIKGVNDKGDGSTFTELFSLASRIKDTIQEFIGFELFIGISKVFNDIRNICNSYIQAIEVIEKAGMMSYNSIACSNELEAQKDYYAYPDNKGKELMYYIENGYREKVFDLINAMFDEVGENRNYITVSIKSTILKLTISIENILNKFNLALKDILGVDFIPSKVIYDTFKIDDLKECFVMIVTNVMNYIDEKKIKGTGNIVNDILDFLNKFYYEDINVISVSGKFFINPSYLSRVFKIKTGLNFNDYITKLRMNKASELLTNKELKVEDVSIMVGYENVNYFFKKFKDHYGCTPSKFRER